MSIDSTFFEEEFCMPIKPVHVPVKLTCDLQVEENSVNNKGDSDLNLDEAFQKSETLECYRELWLKTIERAMNSNMSSLQNSKVRKGRFRIINDSGNMELLPDMDTSGGSKDVLMRWKEVSKNGHVS